MTNPIKKQLHIEEPLSVTAAMLARQGFILFQPIFKKLIWGGVRVAYFKGLKRLDADIGESWEISDLEGDVSVVDNGPLEGLSLDELIGAYGERLLGEAVVRRFGERFPLLIKLIDAADDLSVQVHPDDRLAVERHGSWGKTEMWYVIQAEEGASIYSGFDPAKLTGGALPEELAEESVEALIGGPEESFSLASMAGILRRYDVKEGDAFFLPAGRVHAIRRGCFVAEIQQTSNITYRIYDYDRTDKQGHKRELHIAEAKEAINLEANLSDTSRIEYKPQSNEPVILVRCPYFTTRLIKLEERWTRYADDLDSFIIYMCIAGSALLLDNNNAAIRLEQGQTILIPAATSHIIFMPEEPLTLLEIYWEDTSAESLADR
ncbi:MAG: mannose-6-phosphate isomerase [Tannerellaceae bacterium]|jgi:mannose-6-phosphate isomerase|nr:mannose-6-phosphate isomerase [Tannerellaceae bacterium]